MTVLSSQDFSVMEVIFVTQCLFNALQGFGVGTAIGLL